MRLDILNPGYGLATRLLFALIRLLSAHPVPDAAKLVFYRPDFYGARAKDFTHEAMHGPSAWSVADRELMAAYVSKGARVRVLRRRAHRDRKAGQPGRVAAVPADLESAPVEEPLWATLRMLGKLTREKGRRRGHAGGAGRRGPTEEVDLHCKGTGLCRLRIEYCKNLIERKWGGVGWCRVPAVPGLDSVDVAAFGWWQGRADGAAGGGGGGEEAGGQVVASCQGVGA
ncbi:hypothetical protein [Nonomuraea africana]|uniref:hypothetical protein n=1 Tax=Nonomuraea africana TaxID=46171 RepID=UPI0033CDA393